MLRKPRAVFFDLDDTLLDASGMTDVLGAVCRLVMGGDASRAERLLVANQSAWVDYWPEVEEGWMLGGLSTADVSREAWRRALRACGETDDSLAGLAQRTLFELEFEAYRSFDDAPAVLDAIGRLVPLGLVTNGASDLQRRKLRALGIEEIFAVVAISGEVGAAKPDGRIFLQALDRLGVAPTDSWHVGDSLARDVGGARAAGMQAVWLNRTGLQRTAADPPPDLEISSLAELLPSA